MLTRAEINSQDIPALMADMGARARAASRPLAIATTEQKNAALAATWPTPSRPEATRFSPPMRSTCSAPKRPT